MKKINSAKSLTRLSLLGAISICLSAVEAYIPVIPSIPGGKLGLANIIFLIIMCEFGSDGAFFVNLLRAALSSLLFSGANTFFYSFFGAAVSSLTMILLYRLPKDKISLIGISIAGAFMHNLTQVVISAMTLNNTAILSYMCILSVISVVSGYITGYSALYFTKHKTTENFYE